MAFWADQKLFVVRREECILSHLLQDGRPPQWGFGSVYRPGSQSAHIQIVVVGRHNIARLRVGTIHRPARPSVAIMIRPALGLLTGAMLVK